MSEYMDNDTVKEKYEEFKKTASLCVLCRGQGLIEEQNGKLAYPLFQKSFPSNYLGALFVLQNPTREDTYDHKKGFITCDAHFEETDKTGKQLYTYLESVGLSLDNIILTNSVLCLPKRNGDKNDPDKNQVYNCKDNFKMLVDACAPKVIVTLGKTSFENVNTILSLHYDESFYSTRGNIRSVQGSYTDFVASFQRNFNISSSCIKLPNKPFKIVPVFHPAARPVNRTASQQIEDYRYIWKALNL